jgi:multiple sugar transport system permease protein
MAEAAAIRGMMAPRRRASAWSLWADRHMKWLLVAPAVILILLITLYPLGYSVWVAFVNFDFQIPGHAFVGLQNFEQVIEDPIAIKSLVTTLILSLSSVAIEFLLGLALALAMTKVFRGRGLLMLLFIVPLFIGPVIVGQFWSLMLQKPYGPVDFLISWVLGYPSPISWLTQSPWNFIAIITADVWQWTPFMFVILLAGLTSISPDLYEAAEIDGISRWQVFRHITLPQMAPLILVAVTFRFLDAIKLFDVIFVMTAGGPGTQTYTSSYYLYDVGFAKFHLSQATAGSWIFLILTTLVVIFLVRRMLRPEPR